MRRRTWWGRTRESLILSDTSAYPRRPKTKEPGPRRATEETRRRADIAADVCVWLHERCQWALGNADQRWDPGNTLDHCGRRTVRYRTRAVSPESKGYTTLPKPV